MKKILLSTVILSSILLANTPNLNTCIGCHGDKWDKAALGKSKVLKDMSNEEIKKALLGYKTGEYGGLLKNLMKTQVTRYTKQELIQIVNTIQPKKEVKVIQDKQKKKVEVKEENKILKVETKKIEINNK